MFRTVLGSQLKIIKFGHLSAFEIHAPDMSLRQPCCRVTHVVSTQGPYMQKDPSNRTSCVRCKTNKKHF